MLLNLFCWKWRCQNLVLISHSHIFGYWKRK